MKKILIVVDMQNDFIDGALGTKEAISIVPFVANKIEEYKAMNMDIIFTRDTHDENYLNTQEGVNLPVEHCIEGTHGHAISSELNTDNSVIVDNSVVGTGSYSDNHITRVYVEPTQRRKGYGTYIMKRLEEIIIKNGYNKAILDASLPAAYLYETLGYKSLSHEKYIVENDVVLVYEIMEKYL